MRWMWGVLGAFLILLGLSCSWFSGSSKPKIIVPFENMPVENAMAMSPKWGPDGNYIYFNCWSVWDMAICITDPEGEVVERVLTVDMWPVLDVAPVGNELAYGSTEFVGNGDAFSYHFFVFADLEGNILDTLRTWSTYKPYGRFSKVTDSLFYALIPYEGIRRYNLNSGEYESLILTSAAEYGTGFDLFPDDTALVVGDTVFSLTSNEKRSLPPTDLEPHERCSVNSYNPCYVALSGLGDTAVSPEESEGNDKIVIVDILADTFTVLNAAPRDRKDCDYRGVDYAEFSPDGNSIVYSVYTNKHPYQGYQIALITNVLGDYN